VCPQWIACLERLGVGPSSKRASNAAGDHCDQALGSEARALSSYWWPRHGQGEEGGGRHSGVQGAEHRGGGALGGKEQGGRGAAEKWNVKK